MNFADHFAASYSAARERFRSSAAAAGARVLRSYEHPGHTGPHGEHLSIELAHLGNPQGRRQLLVISGTHGTEGHPGSAAQVAWLKSGDAARLPADTGVLMLHGLNPYGFAHGTRTTENNVDLNRNFVDHGQPHPANPGYEEMRHCLVPEDWSDEQLAAAAAAEQRFADERGADWVFDVLARGQYSDPQGIFYGGVAPEWSHRTLEAIVREHLAPAEKVGLLEWHTGIGAWGEPFFLCFSEPGSAELAQAARWWGAERVLGVRPHGLARPAYQGLVLQAVERFLDGRPLAGGVIEFGTRGGPRVRRALRLDQWLRRHGRRLSEDARSQLHADVLDAFNPVDSAWREAVVHHGLALTRAAAEGVATW